MHKHCATKCLQSSIQEILLVVVKELSIGCYGNVQRMSQSTHVPGKLTRFTNKWLDDGESCVRRKEDLGASVQGTDNILITERHHKH